MFRTVFLDLDDTILDFSAAEAAAISKTFRQVGLNPTEELLAAFRRHNLHQWEAFERGEISREDVLVGRFTLLFRELGLSLDPAATEDIYRGYLGIGHYFVEGAEDILAYLAPKYDLYLASNGVAATQYSRLESAGIRRYFKEIFISEVTGAHKPDRAYFDYCFRHIPGFDPAAAIIIGDSLTSDIQGGKNAGIATCWFNRAGKAPRQDIVPDYEIHCWEELKSIL